MNIKKSTRHRHSSVRMCKDCGKFFILTDNDAIYFIEKYNSLPLRCEECRRVIRETNPIKDSSDVADII